MPDERAAADQEILARQRKHAEEIRSKAETGKEDDRPDATPEEAASRSERKAQVAQLLHRGLVNARLEVKDADPNRYYCWVREHDPDIDRMMALGFEIETEAGQKTHGAGDNRRRIGDVILMSTPKENYEIIQEVRMEQKAKKSQLGKREYLRRAASGLAAPILDPLGVGLGDD
jgi:hypothetical protein